VPPPEAREAVRALCDAAAARHAGPCSALIDQVAAPPRRRRWLPAAPDALAGAVARGLGRVAAAAAAGTMEARAAAARAVVLAVGREGHRCARLAQRNAVVTGATEVRRWRARRRGASRATDARVRCDY
jgi:hypothetical protein